MVSSRRRLALMGACIASLLLAAAFFGSTGSASVGKNRAQSSNNKRSDAAVPARPTLLSPRAGAQRGASGHARAVRTAPLSAHFEGAIDGSDPTQAGRLFRDGIPDTCAAPGTSGLFDSAPRHYDVYEVVNSTGSPSCVEVTVGTDSCTGTNFIYSAGYTPTFNPANILENWQADLGSSRTSVSRALTRSPWAQARTRSST